MIISTPNSIHIPPREQIAFSEFLQQIANRRAVGSLRYGRIKESDGYMSRLSKELAAYKRTGNVEQLLNIAVYAFLESYAPENDKHHFDNTAESVTRKRA